MKEADVIKSLGALAQPNRLQVFRALVVAGKALDERRRTLERQRELVKVGASRTLDSRHLTGHAVDLAAMVGSEVRWDWPLYYRIADAMKLAAIRPLRPFSRTKARPRCCR